MTEPNDPQSDFSDLLAYIAGQLDASAARRVRARLAADPEFQALHDNLSPVAAALELSQPDELTLTPPADLAERTLARIASVQTTNALLAQQEANRPRGFRPTFSLRELIAVAAMFLMLAGVLIPSLQRAQQKGDQSLCAAQMGQIGSALQAFAHNNDGNYPTVAASDPHWLTQGDTPTASNSAALYQLLTNKYVTNPRVFQCPALGGESFALRDDLKDFPDPEHIHYSYQHAIGPRKFNVLDPALADVAEEMAVLADQSPLFSDGAFHPERCENPTSDNHGQTGQNVLYITGNVRWTTEPHAGVGGDNIYLIANLKVYKGNEVPTSATDSFLLPAWVKH